MVEESIIIPMNPKGRYSGGGTPGSIIAQQWFAQKRCKVIISFDKACRYSNSSEKPHLGFFRDTSSTAGLVTHRFSIVDVTDDWGAIKFLEDGIAPWSKNYLPPWRKELYEETKAEPRKQRTWLLINNIYKLKAPKELDYFGKKPSQSFVYSSVGSELSYSEEKPDPDDFIDDIIFRIMRGDIRFTEDDLELIIWAWLVKNDAEYVERQRVPEPKSSRIRLDLLTKLKGEYTVMELKRDRAEREALVNQLGPYMRGIMNKFNLTKLKGKVIARDQSPDLKRELDRTENIEFVPYTFSFKLKKNEEHLFSG